MFVITCFSYKVLYPLVKNIMMLGIKSSVIGRPDRWTEYKQTGNNFRHQLKTFSKVNRAWALEMSCVACFDYCSPHKMILITSPAHILFLLVQDNRECLTQSIFLIYGKINSYKLVSFQLDIAIGHMWEELFWLL